MYALFLIQIPEVWESSKLWTVMRQLLILLIKPTRFVQFKLAYDNKGEIAKQYLLGLKDLIGESFVDEILNTNQSTEAGINMQRENVKELRKNGKSSSA